MNAESSSCDFCGLPIAGSWRIGTGAGAVGAREAQFCCYGCRFAAAVTRERGETGAIRWTLARLGIAIFLSMNVMCFSLALWTPDVYGVTAGEAWSAALEGVFRYLCLLFSLPVLVLLGGPLAEGAWSSLRRGKATTDLLLLSGVTAAFVLSSVSVFRNEGPIYFEVGCVILVMVTLGRWFEASGRLRAGAALDELEKLLPDVVRLVDRQGERRVAVAELVPGDHIRILPGERFPIDGRLVAGSASVDDQVLTGESQPALRSRGDQVLAGTLNLDGAVVVEATSFPGEAALDRLIAAVRQAREAKGHYHELADRAAGLVFPVVAAIAAAAFAGHWAASGFEKGLTSALAVTLVACPCALGLATPLAAWTALGEAARKQVLFRSGQALEGLAQIRAVRFDKTGTLTTGKVRVRACLSTCAGGQSIDKTVFNRAGSLSALSTHPFSRAVHEFAAQMAPGEALVDVRELAGRGLSGRSRDSREAVYLGSPAFLRESGQVCPAALERAVDARETAWLPLVFIGWNSEVQAVFVLEEELRPGVAATLAECRRLGLDVAVLTGDRRGRADRLSAELGVPVRAGLLPEQKLAEIRAAQATIGPVAMVGDGINDAPALAASDAGVALGCGVDVSRDAALVCLLGNDPGRLVWAIAFARQTVRIMRRNLVWAFAYNTIGIALAAAGWLNPSLAALLMVASSVLVVRSALRLAREPADIGSEESMSHRPGAPATQTEPLPAAFS